jgi:ceramide glucosyltransferase
MIIALLAVLATAYQLVAVVACLRFQMQRRYRRGTGSLPVSILKPVRGLDPGFYEAIVSHAGIDYPEFEILFGVADPADPAIPAIQQLQAAYPHRSIQLVQTTTLAPNRKVGVLQDLVAQARYATLVINDSDIRVPANYLQDITAPLADSEVGLVTCLYRATASSFPGRMEALGISTDFAPSTLVAPLVGVNEFGLGSTLAFRRADLAAIGGFAAIAPYLADDYQLARRITTGLKKRAWLSHVIVDTALQADSWGEVWRHQVRWHRTIRVSRPGGYLGLPITFCSVWAFVALATGWLSVGTVAWVARYGLALVAGQLTLRCPIARRYWFLTPLRDFFGAAVWLAGLFGNHVQWRDRRLRLTRDGRIEAGSVEAE